MIKISEEVQKIINENYNEDLQEYRVKANYTIQNIHMPLEDDYSNYCPATYYTTRKVIANSKEDAIQKAKDLWNKEGLDHLYNFEIVDDNF